jgi:transposase
MKREEIKAIYDQGPEAVIDLVERLFSIIEKQQEQINKLTARVQELEERLGKNSHNSSKPPSTDQQRQTKSLRKPTGNKSGGQSGHEGNTLCQVENPDHTIVHKIVKCCDCGFDLQSTPASQYDCRQVFDLPPIKLEVTEHQVEVKKCLQCGESNAASFPDGVDNIVQYGEAIKGFIVYLMNYQLLPYRRTSEIIADLCGQSISQGTLQQTVAECADNLADNCEQIKAAIKQAAVANFDETGLYVAGERFWLHVSATAKLTYYQYHEKRGSEALDAIDILPNFTGTAVHDGYSCYQDYPCQHALCNAHHLRELTFLSEQYGLAWADKMIVHLLKIKEVVDAARQAGKTVLDKIEIAKFARRYQRILREGFAVDIPPQPPAQPQRGRKKQSKAKNLLDRLSKYRQATLAFMYDFNVPFDNNQAERDIRMMKVQQKISGCFRSTAGANIFCKIRSYISSMRKQGHNVFAVLKSVFSANPIQPALSA